MVAAYLVYASLAYAGVGALLGAAVLLAGVPLLLFARNKPGPISEKAFSRRAI
jgi:hypothetical protein